MKLKICLYTAFMVGLYGCDCGGSNNDTHSGDGGTSDGSSPDGSSGFDANGGFGDSGVFPQNDAGQILCGDHVCECDNHMDDDSDGTQDGLDAECTAPYDDDEGSFATGIPGDNMDSCQDCFFDGNSGSAPMGMDDCRWDTGCYDDGKTDRNGACGGSPPDGTCEVSQDCVNFCQQYTPNGCDCFGCCTVYKENGESVDVHLVSTCTLENLDDTTACPRCQQSTTCVNSCGECELCLGKTVEDLPASCNTDAGTPTYTCDMGYTACGEGLAACPSGTRCYQGCCYPLAG